MSGADWLGSSFSGVRTMSDAELWPVDFDTLAKGDVIPQAKCCEILGKSESDPLRRVGRSVLLAIGISLFTPAYADAPVEAKRLTIKEYAAILVDDKDQMICLSKQNGKRKDKSINGKGK